MLKNRLTLIIIIAVIAGLAAGIFAFYRKQGQGSSTSINLISTITLTDPLGTLPTTTKEFNQTLAAVLNSVDYQTQNLPVTTWEADLNSAIIYGQITASQNDYAQLITFVQSQAGLLTQDLYDNQIKSNLKLLREPSLEDSLNQNPWLITILGIIVGGFLGSILIPKKDQ